MDQSLHNKPMQAVPWCPSYSAGQLAPSEQQPRVDRVLADHNEYVSFSGVAAEQAGGVDERFHL